MNPIAKNAIKFHLSCTGEVSQRERHFSQTKSHYVYKILLMTAPCREGAGQQ